MKNQKGRKPFKHLTPYERDRIEHMRWSGMKRDAIALILGRNKGTISRELQKYTNQHGRYRAGVAQTKAILSRTGSKQVGMKIEGHPRLKARIIRDLKALRAPDEIAGRMRKDGCVPRVGKSAIYKWIYSVEGHPYAHLLCSKRIRKRTQSRTGRRSLIPNRISIRQRPRGRQELHGESDLFVSPTTLHSPVVGHMTVVPEALLLVGALLPNKSAYTMVLSMQKITSQIPVTTWTCDNGIENIRHRAFGVDTYFCDKGSPWQKPHVENSIGLTRRWFLPKGTNLSTVPEKTFQSMLFLLNSKYRKSLGYRSAYEVALERGIIHTTPHLSRHLAVAFR
jgi:IS30 family transposase